MKKGKLKNTQFAIITVPAAPVRAVANHRTEMKSQLLFGEAVKILKSPKGKWVKIRSLHDGYEGWLTKTLLHSVSEEEANTMPSFVANDFINTIRFDNAEMQIPFGSSLPFFENKTGRIGEKLYTFPGQVLQRDRQSITASKILLTAEKFLNVPYMWGGRTPLGIDCSGFVQIIFKQLGIDLPRDAWQQAQTGQLIKKVKNCQVGDLAFFHIKKKIVHVGIVLPEGKIIHASGKVRIDTLTDKGIINTESGKKTNKLLLIKRILD